MCCSPLESSARFVFVFVVVFLSQTSWNLMSSCFLRCFWCFAFSDCMFLSWALGTGVVTVVLCLAGSFAVIVG